MQRLGMEKGEAIEHKMVNRAIENAQKKVEEMNPQFLNYKLLKIQPPQYLLYLSYLRAYCRV
jgi:hypothetical protein